MATASACFLGLYGQCHLQCVAPAACHQQRSAYVETVSFISFSALDLLRNNCPTFVALCVLGGCSYMWGCACTTACVWRSDSPFPLCGFWEYRIRSSGLVASVFTYPATVALGSKEIFLIYRPLHLKGYRRVVLFSECLKQHLYTQYISYTEAPNTFQ